MEDNKIFDIVTPQDERIMKFLYGKMTDAEEAAFMEDVKNDAELKKHVVDVARLAKAMKKVGLIMDTEVKNAMSATNSQSIKNIAKKATKATKVKVMRKRLAYISSVAASVVFIVFAGFQYNSYEKTTNLGTEYAMVFDASTLMRGDDNAKIVEELTHLFNNVVAKADTKQTIKDLNTLWKLSTMDVYNDYTDYSQEIGWNLAVAYLMDNDKPQAKGVLEKLVSVSEAESAFGKKAKELLEKINDL